LIQEIEFRNLYIYYLKEVRRGRVRPLKEVKKEKAQARASGEGDPLPSSGVLPTFLVSSRRPGRGEGMDRISQPP